MDFYNGASETINVPNHMVGLVIGRGGEQIAAIQAESDCKIRFQPEISGAPERQCKLSGSPAAIMKAKELIGLIMNRSQPMMMPQSDAMGTMTIEMLVPGNKVGLIIGKGGETIKQLQDRAGVRMLLVQDSNEPTTMPKPLKITGNHIACEKARDMINELMSEKNRQQTGGVGEYAGGRANTEMLVPCAAIGAIIGKGGETIKRLQQDSGARIQFRPENNEGAPHRMCTVSGSQDQIAAAMDMMREIIESSLKLDVGGGGGGGHMNYGRPMGAAAPGAPGGDWNGSHFGDRPQPSDGDTPNETVCIVPAEKCGLVIGKGGETIRELIRASGAHIELSRDPVNASGNERHFLIRGSSAQSQLAIRLIAEKIGTPVPPDQSQMPQQQLANHLPPANPQQMLLGNFQPQQAAMQSWENQAQLQSGMQQQQQLFNPAVATSVGKPMVDANVGNWAVPGSQHQVYAGQAAVNQPAVQPAFSGGSITIQTPQPTINPQTGQPDYSAAWVEYYRQMGLHDQANAILQQQQRVAGGTTVMYRQ